MEQVQTKHPPATLFAALFCVLFSVIFNYTLSIMASPYIVGDLGGSNDIATYTVSFFALGNALSIPLGKPLIPRIGTILLLTILLISLHCSPGVAPSPPPIPFLMHPDSCKGFPPALFTPSASISSPHCNLKKKKDFSAPFP